jgi:P27 family predicted phage terminase small subunit
MGRRRQSPQQQRQRGYPGKRKSKIDRAIEEAGRLAELLAAAPASSDAPLSPPAYVNDKRMQPALAVWNEYAPQLSRSNLLDSVDRHSFAIFCVYMAEFLAAHDDILRNGYSKAVKTISKDVMLRENPAVSRRDAAVKFVMELSKRFGLTPLDRYALMKDQFLVRDQLPRRGGEGDLVDRAAAKAATPAPAQDDTPPAAPAAPAPEGDPLGILNQFDSDPPPSRMN